MTRCACGTVDTIVGGSDREQSVMPGQILACAETEHGKKDGVKIWRRQRVYSLEHRPTPPLVEAGHPPRYGTRNSLESWQVRDLFCCETVCAWKRLLMKFLLRHSALGRSLRSLSGAA